MTSINFSKKDVEEQIELTQTAKKIDQIDDEYFNRLSDEIFEHQPFFMTVLLGLRFEVSLNELDEITRIYFIIWEYFRKNPTILKTKVTESMYNEVLLKNVNMLKYSEEEANPKNIYSQDVQRIKSQSLMSIVFSRFRDRQILADIDIEKKGLAILGIKSFIECFEIILKSKA
ncbi:MAG: hypothetical protein R6U85_03510 [Salinivirgaceae bacterium]